MRYRPIFNLKQKHKSSPSLILNTIIVATTDPGLWETAWHN